jgi:hypothetical protein
VSNARGWSILCRPDTPHLRAGIFVLVQIVSPHVVDALQGLRSVERRPGVDDKAYFERMHDMYQTIYFQVATLAREDLGFATPTP